MDETTKPNETWIELKERKKAATTRTVLRIYETNEKCSTHSSNVLCWSESGESQNTAVFEAILASHKRCEFFCNGNVLGSIISSRVFVRAQIQGIKIDIEKKKLSQKYSADHEFHFEVDLPRWDIFNAQQCLNFTSLLLTCFFSLLVCLFLSSSRHTSHTFYDPNDTFALMVLHELVRFAHGVTVFYPYALTILCQSISAYTSTKSVRCSTLKKKTEKFVVSSAQIQKFTKLNTFSMTMAYTWYKAKCNKRQNEIAILFISIGKMFELYLCSCAHAK